MKAIAFGIAAAFVGAGLVTVFLKAVYAMNGAIVVGADQVMSIWASMAGGLIAGMFAVICTWDGGER